MTRKLIDYRVATPRYTLADFERYIPIIERSVFLNDPTLTQFLVIDGYRLNVERRSREGRMRLTNVFLIGILILLIRTRYINACFGHTARFAATANSFRRYLCRF